MSALVPAFILALSPAAFTGEWELFAPTGGDLHDVAGSPVVPGLVLAGRVPYASHLPGSLYRSLDGGTTWSEMSTHTVHDIEFAAGGTAYVGTRTGLLRVAPDGSEWSAVELGVGPQNQVWEVALDPSDSSAIWLGLGKGTVPPQTKNVLFSGDGGQTWLDRTPPPRTGWACHAIAVDPASSSRVFAAFSNTTTAGGIWFSADRGLTWTERTGDLPPSPIVDIEFVNGRIWIAGGYREIGTTPPPLGVFRSGNLGLTWTAVHDASWPSLMVNDIEVDPADPARIWLASWAGAYFTADGGASWTFGAGETALHRIHEVCVRTQDSQSVLVATNGRSVLRSNDGGASFQPTSMPSAGLEYTAVAVHPSDPQEIALSLFVYSPAEGSGGVYTTKDGGDTWLLEPLPAGDYLEVAYSPDGVLFAATESLNHPAPGVYRRDPGGWTLLGTPVPAPPGRSLAFDPADSTRMMLASGRQIWRSTDAGLSWTMIYETPLNNGWIRAVAALTTPGGLAWFAGAAGSTTTFIQGDFLRSVDDGQTWTVLDSIFTMSALAQSGYDPSVAYAGNAHPFPALLWTSFDHGGTWSACSAPSTDVAGVAVHPASEILVFAAGVGGTVHRSADGGLTSDAWPLPMNGFTTDLAISPDGETLYYTSDAGAWRRRLDSVVPYCATQPNSVGPGAALSWSGSTSVSANDLRLECSALPPNQTGLFYYGPAQVKLPFGNGLRCVGAGGIGLFRLGIGAIGPRGTLSHELDVASLSGAGAIEPGSTWCFQLWYRDPAAGGAGFNFSSALLARFLP